MPTKRKVTQKQKQRQKQSVVVNVNVAKARARASAKKSGAKGGGGGRGSVMMLPPPIYASPIDRLTPAMYGSQGQQIQQQSLDQMLKNFLSNQQNQQVGSFKTLGSAPGSSSVSYNPRSVGSGDPIPDYGSTSSYPRPLNDNERFVYNEKTKKTDRLKLPIYDDDVSEMSDPSYMSDIPTPFQNEERSYLKASEPDYEANAPQFSEKLKPEHSIYETIRQMEEGILREQDLINQSRKWVEDSYKNSPIKSSPSKTNIIQFDESSGSNQSLGSFPGMYGPRVPVNKSDQEGYFEKYYD